MSNYNELRLHELNEWIVICKCNPELEFKIDELEKERDLILQEIGRGI